MLNDFNEEWTKIEKRYMTKEHVRNLEALKKKLLNRPIVLFGVGFFGALVSRGFADHGLEVACFCDSKKTGVEPESGLAIISTEQLRNEFSDSNVVLSVAAPHTQRVILRQLLGYEFPRDRVFTFDTAFRFLEKSRVEITHMTIEQFRNHLDGYESAYRLFNDDLSKKIILDRMKSYLFSDPMSYSKTNTIYFPTEFSLMENEIFIDAGLYTGNTSEEFIRQTNGKYRRIVGFDIDGQNIELARKNLNKYPSITIIQKGLWSSAMDKKACLGNLAGSSINEDGKELASLVSLDEFFSEMNISEWPTFIKMDIEGAEKAALIGGKNMIKKTHPKMAICAYHKPEDIYELPKLILDCNPDYKLVLRHYSPYTWDTVLYASDEMK
jgi:FkbM family methyltransferase